MRRAFLLPLLFLGLLTGGCETGGGAPPGPPTAAAQVRVGFGGLVDTIEIAAVDRLPLRAADLVAPDGAATPASAIDVADSPHLATGQWAASNPWHDAVSGNSALAAAMLGQAQAGAALQSREQLLAAVSTAVLPLPDPVAYRRDWMNYRIRLVFGTPPGEVETREMPAPAPPPQ